MSKQLNQWLDEFIENGADATDVTNWPENAGGEKTPELQIINCNYSYIVNSYEPLIEALEANGFDVDLTTNEFNERYNDVFFPLAASAESYDNRTIRFHSGYSSDNYIAIEGYIRTDEVYDESGETTVRELILNQLSQVLNSDSSGGDYYAFPWFDVTEYSGS